MPGKTGTVVQKEIVVNAPIDIAFSVFTAETESWWPLATHSVHHEKAKDIVVENRMGGRLIEKTSDGTESTWGTIFAWEPPHRVAFTWHPGEDGSAVTEVDVRFEAKGAQTVVTLTHSGWERLDDGTKRSEDYASGWETVLGFFGAKLNATE